MAIGKRSSVGSGVRCSSARPLWASLSVTMAHRPGSPSPVSSASKSLGSDPCLAQAEKVTFAQAQVGSLPKDFEAELTGDGLPGLWAIVTDKDAQSGRALEQRTPDPTEDRFPLAIYEPVRARNVEATVEFKTLYGKVDQPGGVAVRLIDPNNYYVARAKALEDNVRFYRVVGGKREQIASAETRVTPGEWHTLTLRAEG